MSAAPIDLDEVVRVAEAAVDRAGELLRRFAKLHVAAETKADLSPVTVADRAVEEALRDAVMGRFPDHGVIGEELGSTQADSDFVWVFDPIDGTKAFLAGKPTFVTLAALLYRGKPLVGVIDQPLLRDRWVGVTGRPTQRNGELVRGRACAGLATARLSSTGPQHFTGEERPRFEAVAAAASFVTWGGDGYQYGLVAAGSLDLVVEAGLALHDWAALEPVVAGAGGAFTDWEGQAVGSTPGGRVLAAGDPLCHAEALALLRGEPR